MAGSGGLSLYPVDHGYRRRAARGFSLVDVLVSIGVIAVLIALLMPSLGKVRETARQAVCGSNLRQVGIGVNLFADRHDGKLPSSVFLDRNSTYRRHIPDAAAQRYTVLIHMRTINYLGAATSGLWDGLGKLYEESIPPAGAIFYCPSHKGEHTFNKYAIPIADSSGDIFMNYQYRGQGPYGGMRLFQIDSGAALVADAMAGEEFFNHESGFNVLRIDNSVGWFADNGGAVAQRLAATSFGDEDDSIPDVWQLFDRNGSSPQSGD